MVSSTHASGPSILDTVDEFIAAVPWGNRSVVLVHRRDHGGREYIRLRTWNRHKTENYWYPTKRGFVIQAARVEDLVEAIYSAAEGESLTAKPDWLVAREQAEDEALLRLADLGMPPETIEQEKKRLGQARRGRM